MSQLYSKAIVTFKEGGASYTTHQYENPFAICQPMLAIALGGSYFIL